MAWLDFFSRSKLSKSEWLLFDLSGSHNVKSDGAGEIPIDDFY